MDKCPECGNIIELSNTALICKECGARFCHTCEGWFREERKRGQKPLCENCFDAKRELQLDRKMKGEGGQEEKESHKTLAKEGNSIGMKFTYIPAGEFMMGSENGDGDEQPVHKVTITKPFHLGIYPVTQREWKAVMGDKLSIINGDYLPIDGVSWNDVQEFITKLNAKEGSNKYRLPSEAEWEYACRAGITTEYYFGDDESELGMYAWYYENSNGKTHSVGQKKPNSWGLYDMHGNVFEFVQDLHHVDYKGAPSDGSVWRQRGDSNRIVRGGSWYNDAWYCRSASRNDDFRYDLIGFRLLKEL